MGVELVELVMSVEEQFGITLSDADAERADTPAKLIDIVMAKVDFPQTHATVGQLTEFLVAFAPSVGGAPGGRWSRPDVAAAIRELTIEHLGLKPGLYREDARFVQDLGGS